MFITGRDFLYLNCLKRLLGEGVYLRQILEPRTVMHLIGLQNKAAGFAFAFKKDYPKTTENI